MVKLFAQIKKSHRFLCKYPISGLIENLKLKIALKLLPNDIKNLLSVIIDKLYNDYEKLDAEKRKKISTLTVDFGFRE